jgi:hypothetical protein
MVLCVREREPRTRGGTATVTHTRARAAKRIFLMHNVGDLQEEAAAAVFRLLHNITFQMRPELNETPTLLLPLLHSARGARGFYTCSRKRALLWLPRDIFTKSWTKNSNNTSQVYFSQSTFTNFFIWFYFNKS